MYYYGIIENGTNIVVEVLESESQITLENYNQITAEQYNDPLFLGSLYDAETGTYSERYTPMGNIYELRDVTGKKTWKKVEDDKKAEFLSHGHTAQAIIETTDKKIMTAAERNKLSNIAENANNYSHPASHPASMITGLAGVATSGSYNDLTNKPATYVHPASHPVSMITGLASVATSGSYTDLTDKPATMTPTEHIHAQTDITGLASALSGKASSTHTHTAAEVGAATSNHTHSNYANSSHTHAASTITGLSSVAISGSYTDLTDKPTAYVHPTSHPATMITGLAGVATSGSYNDLSNKPTSMAPTAHTHAQADITGLTTALSSKADSSHTHTASEVGAAASNHTHSNYADIDHTHSNYATTSHTHTAIANDLDVQGVIRADGVQAVFFSGTNSILGSGNYPTIIAGTQTTLNGTKTYAPNIYPRGGGDFTLGATSNRWTNIYSKNAVNVSSDIRLKENIKDADETKSAEFINKIKIKNYNYIGDETEKIGIIAQQLIDADPELSRYFVHQDENGYFGVTTADLIFPLIATVQKLTKEVEELKKRGQLK